jgi:hypothetical protein
LSSVDIVSVARKPVWMIAESRQSLRARDGHPATGCSRVHADELDFVATIEIVLVHDDEDSHPILPSNVGPVQT